MLCGYVEAEECNIRPVPVVGLELCVDRSVSQAAFPFIYHTKDSYCLLVRYDINFVTKATKNDRSSTTGRRPLQRWQIDHCHITRMSLIIRHGTVIALL